MRARNMESDVSHTEKSCPTFQGKDHELLAIADSLDNVYLGYSMLAYSLWDLGNSQISTMY